MATQQQAVLRGKVSVAPVVSAGYAQDTICTKRVSFGKKFWITGDDGQHKLRLPSNAGSRRLRLESGRPWSRVSSSLGFTADPRIGIERAANALLRDAAMLLVYQDVFRSPPAQAFLKVLLALRRSDDGLKILESYGEFFRLMAIGRYPSWEDYILEGILSGENNPFAEAAANVRNPKSAWSGGIPPSLHAAAAADLDSLQRLSITESTLSGWVTEMVADVKPEWRTAAASNLGSKSITKSPAVSEAGSSTFGFAIPGGVTEQEAKVGKDSESGRDNIENSTNTSAPEESESIGSEAPGGYSKSIHRFLLQDRERWRKKIGGLWKWSNAVPLLENYYADHSVGRVASTQFLQWKGGKLMGDQKWVTKISSSCDLSIHKQNREALVNNLTRHAQGSTAHHVLLYGPTGIGKTWLLRSVLSEVTSTKDLRLVAVPVAELKGIYPILEELSRHWRLRFALVVDDLLSRGGEENYALLKSALDGNLQEWPENVLICATSSRKVAIQGKDGAGYGDFAHLFGLTLEFENLDEVAYLSCTSELLDHRKSKGSVETSQSSETVATQAKFWAERLNVWNVRSAAQFVNTLE